MSLIGKKLKQYISVNKLCFFYNKIFFKKFYLCNLKKILVINYTNNIMNNNI